MAANGQDAILLTTPADIAYVTGFLTRFWESPARPWFVVVPASGDPVAVIPSIGAPLMRRGWVTDVRTWDAPDPEDDGVSLLLATLSGIVRETGTIGIPMGLETHVRMPLADLQEVLAHLAPRRVADATAVVERVREVKSETEIDLIRQTAAVAERAFARVPEIVAASPRLDHVFRGFQAALLEEGADWVSYVAGAAGPGGYGDVISPATAQPLMPGDVLMLDTGAVRQGYFCDFDRNFSIGRPAPETVRAQHALWDATEALLKRMRPGWTARDAHACLTEALTARGYPAPGGRLGHGLGLTLTEWPSFTALDRTVLVENMVLTIEPSVEVVPGRILVHEENVVLRPEGPELLTARAPRDMAVIDL